MLMKHKKEGNKCCPTKPIIPSPVTAAYRNKCSFSVGVSTTGEKTVGFRLGKYRLVFYFRSSVDFKSRF